MIKHVLMSGALLLYVCAGVAFAQDGAQKNEGASIRESLEKSKRLIDERRFDEAIALVDEALRQGPDDAALHLQLGRALANKYFVDGSVEHKTKAVASLRKSLELNPSLAYAHFLLGQIASAGGQYKEAIKDFSEATRLDPSLAVAYLRKWRLMVKGPDFENYLPLIRAEIENVLKRIEDREAALEIAAQGFELLADDESVKRIEDLILAELPKSKLAERVLIGRIYSLADARKQVAQIQIFLAQFPASHASAELLERLFRSQLFVAEIADAELIKSARAWVAASTRNAEQMIKARSQVALALAERKLELALAESFAEEAVKLADELKPDSPLLSEFKEGERDSLIRLLRERARRARGFVALRRGDAARAVNELSAELQPVVKEVERNGFILWKDMDLRELGVRPRVLWLAEAYETQGQLERAARYLLAGLGDDNRANDFIKARLPVIYQKLGRPANDAPADLRMAEARYRSLMERAASSKEEEKRRLLAARINAPAKDFRITRLDKRELRLSDLKGKVIALNFWATWCGPCLAELPHFQKAFEKYKDNSQVVFVAVSIDENRAAVRPLIEKRGYSFVTAYDESAAQSYGVGNIPATIIIDRDGMIQFREEGFGGEGKDYTERLIWRIDELLNSTNRGGNGRQR
jgi:thiol-disulfide isomerase/thioredoxin/tetratricopeptide (TPR) repeat protein